MYPSALLRLLKLAEVGAQMKTLTFRAVVSIVGVTLWFTAPCLAQSLPKFGIGAKLSTLGLGIEGATAVTRQSNVRGGFNFQLSLDPDFSTTGINYSPQFRYQSLEAHFDWFFGGFHVSPGVLVGTSPDPLSGAFYAGPNHVSPMLTVGWGNLLSRKGGRFSFNIEGGVAFRGSPEVDTGSLENPFLEEFRARFDDVALPGSLSNFAKYYPVLSIGIGFRIK